MASRVVEVLYRLKDFFTPSAKKISGGYEEIGRSSKRAADQVERSTTRMGSAIERTRAGISRLRSAWFALTGILAGGAFIRGVAATADELDRLGKTADRLGISANSLNAFEFAAERSGVAASKIAASLETLQKRTGEAAQGIGEARRAFEAFGIDVEQFTKLDVEQQLILLGDAFASVADEEERAALASQLFSKANIEILNLLNQGGGAIRAYVKEAKALNTITEEQTANAAKFNDNLRNAQEALQGFLFSIGGRALEGSTLLAESLGLSANELRNLEQAVFLAQRAVDRLPDSLSKSSAQYKLLTRELAAAQAELRAFALARGRAAIADAEAAKEQQKQQAINKEYTASLNELNEEIAEGLQTRSAAITKETQELEAARRAQLQIEEEFAQRFKDITTRDLQPEDVNLGDVFGAQRRAAAAAAEGDAESAASIAREGFDLLELLQEKGTETAGTIQFLARELKRAATEAAASDVASEQTQVDQAAAAFAEAQKQADLLRANAPQLGSDFALAWLEGAQQAFAQNPLVPNIEQPTAARRSAPRGSPDITSYSDGTDYRESVDRAGRK